MRELIPLTLPDTIDSDLFADFISARREGKKPMTPTAVRRLERKLARLQGEGHCPNKLLERSIINGWQDVWPDDSTMRQMSNFTERHTDVSWRNGL